METHIRRGPQIRFHTAMNDDVIIEVVFLLPSDSQTNLSEVPAQGYVRLEGEDRAFQGWIDLLDSLEPVARAVARRSAAQTTAH